MWNLTECALPVGNAGGERIELLHQLEHCGAPWSAKGKPSNWIDVLDHSREEGRREPEILFFEEGQLDCTVDASDHEMVRHTIKCIYLPACTLK